MAISNPYPQPAPPDDFTYRLRTLRPAVDEADPRMVVQPFADPGYRMPNPDKGNLNQMPGQEVSGWLPAGGMNSLSPQMLMLFRQRPELLQRYLLQQNQLAPPTQ